MPLTMRQLQEFKELIKKAEGRYYVAIGNPAVILRDPEFTEDQWFDVARFAVEAMNALQELVKELEI